VRAVALLQGRVLEHFHARRRQQRFYIFEPDLVINSLGNILLLESLGLDVLPLHFRMLQTQLCGRALHFPAIPFAVGSEHRCGIEELTRRAVRQSAECVFLSAKVAKFQW